MLYFNCTSVFHTFIISYIMIKEFSEPEAKACLVIPGHVKNLVDLVPNLEKLPFIEKVIVIEESCADLDENDTLKTLHFKDTDKIFVGGMERIGMWLLHKGIGCDARIIVFEEGVNVINDIETYIDVISTLGTVENAESFPKYIREIWKLDGNVKSVGVWENIEVHDLEMKKYLHDELFMEKILKCMNMIFPNREKVHLAKIIFFDNYKLAACRNCSRTMEKNILKKIVSIISEWNYEIKPHPNDITEWKYEDDYSVSLNQNIPIEILRLRNLNSDVNEKIYISYGFTGCITNEILLLGGRPYVIFLYKILKLYGIEYPGEPILEELFERCDDIQKERIFTPGTFVELEIILNQIAGKNMLDQNELEDLKKKEIIDTGKEVRELYKKIFMQCPDELNETAIMTFHHSSGWTVLANEKILLNEKNYKIQFDIQEMDNDKKNENLDHYEARKFRWYIARGAIVKVNLHRIFCIDQDGCLVQEIEKRNLMWLDSEVDQNKWQVFNNCDSLVEFQIEEKNLKLTQKIVIEAEIICDFSYEAMLQLRNKNLENLTHIIDRLASDNETREQSIQQLNGYLKDWEGEVRNRDEEIKLLIQQRDELNATLVKEREQWQARFLEQETKAQKSGHLIDRIFKR